MREFLIDTSAHIPPAHALEGLPSEAAERRVPGTSHSIAEIVAHLDFWQRWFCGRCEGSGAPLVASARDGWPPVTAGSWDDVRQRFLDGLDEITALAGRQGDLDQPVAPAIEFPPLAKYTRRDVLTHVASHNSHHLGQVILLRQMMGAWPPPAGSWTW